MIDEKWLNRFMRIAKEISTWSKDPSTKIGAVVVDDNRRILATGYNGFPYTIEDSDERLMNRDYKYSRIIHAEMNCLLNALGAGVSVNNATLFIYGLPMCPDCAKAVIQSGIKHVVMGDLMYYCNDRWYDQWKNKTRPMLEESSVKYLFIDPRDIGDSWKNV